MKITMVSKGKFALCVHNEDYPASLEMRKVYRVVPDASASRRGLIRVIDESGEDYLYPSDYFVRVFFRVRLPQSVQRAILAKRSNARRATLAVRSR
jgi:hypothetical protein